MGKAKQPQPVKVIISMLTGDPELWDEVVPELEGALGPADLMTQAFPFTHTEYYAAEFGLHLQRKFITFRRLVPPDKLPEIKNLTNSLEARWADEGRRRVNLDPGYVSLSKLVLATTKNHGHRLYLGQGIYGEVTLRYYKGTFAPWPWTYPDYASKPYLELCNQIRKTYAAQLRQLGQAAGAPRSP